jgi:hypothetical protein
VFKALEVHQTADSIRVARPKDKALDKRSSKTCEVLSGDGEALRFGPLRQTEPKIDQGDPPSWSGSPPKNQP